MTRVGIAADHAGFDLKSILANDLRAEGYEIRDFGSYQADPDDDYPRYIIPLAQAVAAGEIERGVAVCGSGAGACIAANKVVGARASLVHDVFTARQAVEDDDMNIICLGGRVIGSALAWELVQAFLAARFSNAERHRRRLAMVRALEGSRSPSLNRMER
jgi:ribose 5-phosphate isomerase B